MEKKHALVLGATGATGTELVKLLLNDSSYVKVSIFGRNICAHKINFLNLLKFLWYWYCVSSKIEIFCPSKFKLFEKSVTYSSRPVNMNHATFLTKNFKTHIMWINDKYCNKTPFNEWNLLIIVNFLFWNFCLFLHPISHQRSILMEVLHMVNHDLCPIAIQYISNWLLNYFDEQYHHSNNLLYSDKNCIY